MRRAPAPKPVAVRPLPAPVKAPATAPAIAAPPMEAAAPGPAEWRGLDPDNTLVVDTDRGRMVIELRPEFAPQAVARIKRLVRARAYDDLPFPRVVDGFMAETAPAKSDGAAPDLPAEVTFRLGAEIPRARIARPQGETEGFIGAQPYVAVDESRMAISPDRRVSAWGAFCPGVVAMSHDADAAGAEGAFFIMRAPTRTLDRNYAVVGRVVIGLEVVRALAPGDPPVQPSRMLKARLMADLPATERPQASVLSTLGPGFRALADQVRTLKGADFSICDLEPPVRVTASGLAKPVPVGKKASRRTARGTEPEAPG